MKTLIFRSQIELRIRGLEFVIYLFVITAVHVDDSHTTVIVCIMIASWSSATAT